MCVLDIRVERCFRAINILIQHWSPIGRFQIIRDSRMSYQNDVSDCQKAELRKILTILWDISNRKYPNFFWGFQCTWLYYKDVAIFSTIEKCLKHTLKPFTFFRTAWKHFRVAIKVLKFLWLDHLTTWPYCSHFKNSPSEVIVRNNEGQLFHSYILLNWFTQGNGTPFGSRSGQKTCTLYWTSFGKWRKLCVPYDPTDPEWLI